MRGAPGAAAEVNVTERTCHSFKKELRLSATPIEVGQRPCAWNPVNLPCGMATSELLLHDGQKHVQAEDDDDSHNQELREFVVGDGRGLRNLGDPAIDFRDYVDDQEANKKRREQESNHVSPTMHPRCVYQKGI